MLGLQTRARAVCSNTVVLASMYTDVVGMAVKEAALGLRPGPDCVAVEAAEASVDGGSA